MWVFSLLSLVSLCFHVLMWFFFSREDVVLFRCGVVYASLRSCYSVLCGDYGGVDDNVSLIWMLCCALFFWQCLVVYSICVMINNDGQYVRVAAALYTKIWQSKYEDRSFRCMLDPTFGVGYVVQNHMLSCPLFVGIVLRCPCFVADPYRTINWSLNWLAWLY